jgi:predicted nuclease of restriction endonuclease-like RecB superfamily
VRPLKGERRRRAEEIAEQLVLAAKGGVGEPRETLEEAWAIEVASKERLLLLGLRKLLDDRCTFETAGGLDPVAVRRAVFERSAAARAADGVRAAFDRAAILQSVAEDLDSDAASVEAALFGDLKAAQRLTAVDVGSPRELTERYDLAQAQAVLLKAVRVTARVGGADPDAYRALFRRLKFQRLLFTCEPEGDGYRLEIDGPYSLFSSSTKYGLQLAIALPALAALPRCEIEADVRWGKQKSARTFVWTREDARLPAPDESPRMRDDVERLLDDVNGRDDAWSAAPADVMFHVPGAGVCVPDVALTNEESGAVVYVEVLGFWSRDAVWKRVELIERGLDERVLFAVSSRLRVSEKALDDDAPGALYVYKGVMSARRVVDKAAEIARR